MSQETSSPKHFFLLLLLLQCRALQFVRKHFSILNDISLWADNWRDSVNCNNLKVLSNYTDSHRHVKVSASLCGATPMMRQPPIIETRPPVRGTSCSAPQPPPHPPTPQRALCRCKGTRFGLGFVVFSKEALRAKGLCRNWTHN